VIPPEGGTATTVRVKAPKIFVPGDKAPCVTILAMDIGAYSDSIADPDLRDAVADVAALLSLHGNIIWDLDAKSARRRRRVRADWPDVVVSVPGHRPHRMHESAVTLMVGVAESGRELAVRLSARRGFGGELPGLARIITADQPASRRTDARAT
jgi:hypothetical protein